VLGRVSCSLPARVAREARLLQLSTQRPADERAGARRGMRTESRVCRARCGAPGCAHARGWRGLKKPPIEASALRVGVSLGLLPVDGAIRRACEQLVAWMGRRCSGYRLRHTGCQLQTHTCCQLQTHTCSRDESDLIVVGPIVTNACTRTWRRQTVRLGMTLKGGSL